MPASAASAPPPPADSEDVEVAVVPVEPPLEAPDRFISQREASAPEASQPSAAARAAALLDEETSAALGELGAHLHRAGAPGELAAYDDETRFVASRKPVSIYPRHHPCTPPKAYGHAPAPRRHAWGAAL